MVTAQESVTAKICTFARAYHSNVAHQKIFDDYLAFDMMGKSEYDEIRQLIEEMILHDCSNYGTAFNNDLKRCISPIPLSRAAFAENQLGEFTYSHGVCQYVICGAGMDTFAFRNTDPGIRIFEIDHPDTQKYKLEKINELEWHIPCNVRYAAVDFLSDDMESELLSVGFDRNIPTFFAILGVTYYLSLPVFEQTLEQISRIVPPGSRVVFDYPDEMTFTDRCPARFKQLMDVAENLGEHMEQGFSYSELKSAAEKYHFYVQEHLAPDDIQNKFFGERKDGMKAFENIHLITLEKL